MRELADLPALESWYTHLEVDRALAGVDDAEWRAFAEEAVSRARGKDHLHAAARLTEVVDGQRRIVADPPLVVPLRDIPVERLGGEVEDLITHSYAEYLKTARDDVRVLLGRFRHVDAAQDRKSTRLNSSH